MDEQFAYLVLEIVAEIPAGKVATYQRPRNRFSAMLMSRCMLISW